MRLRRPSGMTLLTTVTVVVMAYLLLIPLLTQLISSLRGPGLPFGVPTAEWTLDNYLTLFEFGSGLGATLVQTTLFVGGAAVISTLLAFGLAWLVVRTDLRFRVLISALVLVPYIIPPIVRAQSYVLMLAPKGGILNELLRLFPWWSDLSSGPIEPFTFAWVVIIQGFASVTFPFLLLLPILSNMDGSLEEASRMSGASAWRTVRRVTLPVIWPAMLGIIILQVILLIGALEIPLLFGQQEGRRIFSLQLFTFLRPSAGQLVQYGLAATYGVIFLVLTALIFQWYRRVTRDANRRASISGKGFRPTRLPLGRWGIPALLLVGLYLVPTALLPGIALTWAAVTPYLVPITWDNLTLVTLDAFEAVLGDRVFWESLGRTVIIAGASSTIAVAVATVAAWTVARKRSSLATRLLDVFASSSVAIPATIAGFASFLFYLTINRSVPLLGTIWVLILAYSYRIAVSYRVSYSATLQISPELEESAAASGASRLTTFRRILVPLLLPTTMAVWIQLFILGAHEFAIPALGLATPRNMPLSYYLYAKINPQAAQDYAPNEGAAMALLFTVFVFAIGYGFRYLANRRSLARVAGQRRKDLAAEAASGVTTGAAPS